MSEEIFLGLKCEVYTNYRIFPLLSLSKRICVACLSNYLPGPKEKWSRGRLSRSLWRGLGAHPAMQPLAFLKLRPPPPLTVPHCRSPTELATDGASTPPPKQRRPEEMVGGRGGGGRRPRGRPRGTRLERGRERVSTRPTVDGSGDERDGYTDGDAPHWHLPFFQNRAFEEYYKVCLSVLFCSVQFE